MSYELIAETYIVCDKCGHKQPANQDKAGLVWEIDAKALPTQHICPACLTPA